LKDIYMNKELMDMMRNLNPDTLAAELTSVQPIDINIEALFKGASEKELEDAGYKPVSSTQLLWVKE